MGKTSYVLQALSLLGPEEILKLSGNMQEKRVAFKKAIGAELFVWDESSAPKKISITDAKILAFPKVKTFDLLSADDQEDGPLEEENPETLMATENVLIQREIAKETEEAIQRRAAIKGYQKSTEMYVVKSPTSDGKEKIRFASTDGVLINKKQA